MRSLNLRFATLQGVHLQPNEDGGKAVLQLQTVLTPAIADKLGIKEMCFTEKGSAREKVESFKLDIVSEQFDARIAAGSEEWSFAPQKARGFCVSKSRIEDDEGQLLLRFRVHIVGADEIAQAFALFMEVNKDKFGFKLSSKQGDLFASTEDDEEEEEEQDEPEPDEENEPALARAGQMGGTHQKKKRRNSQPTLAVGEQDTSVLRGINEAPTTTYEN